MEPADIDWKNTESRYVRDDTYENISAPRWIDLSAPDAPVDDDEAWFCRPDCRHPKTAEDFQRWTPSPKMKHVRSSPDVLPLGERNNNHRDGNLKRRGITLLSSSSIRDPTNLKPSPKKFREDLENQNPNLSTPPANLKVAPMAGKVSKEAVKSSAEKRGEEESKHKKAPPRLRSTLSARNLFSGKDNILNQISEFCHELKKLAVRRERSSGYEKVKEEEKKVSEAAPNLDSKRKDEAGSKSSRMLVVDSEEEKCKKGTEKSRVLREVVRSCPPTPQRFPSPSSRRLRNAKATTTTANTSSPLNKPPKSIAPGRVILQELEQSREEKRQLLAMDEDNKRASSVSSGTEARSVDVFWFLKPCTYLVN